MTKRFWYYKPFQYDQWKPVTHGSCDGNRCTLVIGSPITGHIIIPRKKNCCVTWNKEEQAVDIFLRVNSTEAFNIFDAESQDKLVGIWENEDKELSAIEIITVFKKPKVKYDRKANMVYISLNWLSRYSNTIITKQIHSQVNGDYWEGLLVGVEIFCNQIKEP